MIYLLRILSCKLFLDQFDGMYIFMYIIDEIGTLEFLYGLIDFMTYTDVMETMKTQYHPFF